MHSSTYSFVQPTNTKLVSLLKSWPKSHKIEWYSQHTHLTLPQSKSRIHSFLTTSEVDILLKPLSFFRLNNCISFLISLPVSATTKPSAGVFWNVSKIIQNLPVASNLTLANSPSLSNGPKNPMLPCLASVLTPLPTLPHHLLPPPNIKHASPMVHPWLVPSSQLSGQVSSPPCFLHPCIIHHLLARLYFSAWYLSSFLCIIHTGYCSFSLSAPSWKDRWETIPVKHCRVMIGQVERAVGIARTSWFSKESAISWGLKDE